MRELFRRLSLSARLKSLPMRNHAWDKRMMRREKDRKQSEIASSRPLLKATIRVRDSRAGATPSKSDGKSGTAKTGPPVPATPAL